MNESLPQDLQSRIREWTSSEEGTAFIEYVILATVAVVLILGAIQVFFGGVAEMWANLTSTISGAA